MTTASISGYERGALVPPPETVSRLAGALDFPADFFSAVDPAEISGEAASFRSLSSMTARRRHSVLAAGSLAVELNAWIEDRFDLPKTDLPQDLDIDTAATAAAALRAYWQLGERPVANMVHLLEAKGIRVFSLTEDCVAVDAFSTWVEEQPFVFLNMHKSGERGRFDAAHELGHLVLHRHGGATGRTAENEANAFASAFLMPERTMRGLVPRVPSLSALTPVKKRWKVSLAATLRRFFDLELIGQWHYDRLNIEISKRGGRKSEIGGPLPRESSQLLRKVFLALREDGVGRADIARALAVPVAEIDSLIFGLVLDSVSGEGESTAPTRSHLRLVK